MEVLSTLTILPVAISLSLYLVMASAFVRAMTTRRRSECPRAPRISILKPIAGLDEDLRANLESFAAIDYPAFELVIGVADRGDPALPVVREFLAAHPALDAKLVFTDRDAAMNPKVAQLLGLEQVATGEILLISDANVRVRPDYLFGIAEGLLRPGVGLVSNVVAGTGERTWGAALENLQLGALIAPGVVASSVLGARPLTVGKSMAMWRSALAKVGGLRSVGSVLAEDYVLGRRFREAGFGVSVILSPVENRNVACTIGRTVERHTRWAKMRRAIVPRAFLFEPILEPVVVATAAFLIAPSRARAGLVLFCAALQVAMAALAVRIVRGHALGLRHVILEPLRAFVVQLCWLRALASRRIAWRGHPFVLAEDSTLLPIPADSSGPSSVRRLRAAISALRG
jgi:ceramide glucosyltransferase